MSRVVNVHVSHAERDRELWERLNAHLSMLRHRGLVTVSSGRKEIVGRDVRAAARERLSRADLIMLLVTPSFLADDRCYEIELPIALELQSAGQAAVVPVLGRPVRTTGAPFEGLSLLPSNGVAVSTWADQDEAWTNVAGGIESLVAELGLSPPRAPVPARGAPASRPGESVNHGASPRTRVEIFETLERIPPTAFEKVLFHSGAPLAELPPGTVAQSDRALALLRLFEARGEGGLLALGDAISRAGW